MERSSGTNRAGTIVPFGSSSKGPPPGNGPTPGGGGPGGPKPVKKGLSESYLNKFVRNKSNLVLFAQKPLNQWPKKTE